MLTLWKAPDVHDAVPKHQIVELLRPADISMHILANVPVFYYGMSYNKFFDDTAASLPVLRKDSGWLTELINKTPVALQFRPRNPRHSVMLWNTPQTIAIS